MAKGVYHRVKISFHGILAFLNVLHFQIIAECPTSKNEKHPQRAVLNWFPEVDRGRLDASNFTAVVMDYNGETGLCTLGTKVGTLDTQFSRNQFELLTQKFLSAADVPQNVSIGVREAARLHSNTGGQGFFKCSCQTKCETKRCKCNKDGVRCNSRCHKNRSCHNHDNILI